MFFNFFTHGRCYPPIEIIMTNKPIPTFNQLKESGEFQQWLEWSDEDWENIPETIPDLEKYRMLKTGNIMQQDRRTLLQQAQQGDLFAQCAAAIFLRESDPEQSSKYVQNLCQNRFFFFLILFVSNPAAASFFEIDLPREKAYELIMQDAHLRHPFEQFMIGSSFMNCNNGFEQDEEQGLYYLTLSARNGCMESIAWLGEIYFSGTQTIKKDLHKSLKCYELAYEHGIEHSDCGLGATCLQLGIAEQMMQATAACMPYVIYEYYPPSELVERGLKLLNDAKNAGNPVARRILDDYNNNPPHCPMAIMYQKMTGLPIEFKD